MPHIFLSYRREDSKWIAGRVCDRLANHYGQSSVFIDIDIGSGVDFRDHLKQVLAQCDIVLAIIGPKWAGAREGASPRLFQEDDWIRLEIATAIKNAIPIIPILVDGAHIPIPSELPQEIRELSFRTALTLDSGSQFHSNVERLILSIDRLTSRRAPEIPKAKTLLAPRNLRNWFIAGLGILGLAGAASYGLITRNVKDKPPDPAETAKVASGPRYCKQLTQVVDAAQKQFVSIARGEITKNDLVDSLIQLDGWNDCLIGQTDANPTSRYLSCVSANLPETYLPKAIELVGADVASCLGGSWQIKRRTSSSGPALELISNISPYVGIRISRGRVMLEVNAK